MPKSYAVVEVQMASRLNFNQDALKNLRLIGLILLFFLACVGRDAAATDIRNSSALYDDVHQTFLDTVNRLTLVATAEQSRVINSSVATRASGEDRQDLEHGILREIHDLRAYANQQLTRQVGVGDAQRFLTTLSLKLDALGIPEQTSRKNTLAAKGSLTMQSLTYQVSFNESAYDFGSVAVGESVTLTATLTNTGTGDVSFESGYPKALAYGFSTAYSVTGTTCTGTLIPGASCEITVRFAPDIAGTPNGFIAVYVNESTDLFAADLRGTALTEETYLVAFSAPSYDFGSVVAGESATLTATLTNTGTGDVSFESGYPKALAYGFSTAYSVTGTTCAGTLIPAASCEITVRFAPDIAGTPNGFIAVYLNESTDLFAADLRGTTVAALYLLTRPLNLLTTNPTN